MSSETIELRRVQDDSFVDADLLGGMSPDDFLLVANDWASERSLVLQELLKAGVPREKWPQSIHWDWRQKGSDLNLLEATGFGVTFDQHWQGAMLTKTASHTARLDPDKNKPLVYIDFLEIAPWNWPIPEINRPGQFRQVGSALFWKAVKQSEQEGFKGRVGLHALPQAELFYEKAWGMTRLVRDDSKENLLYMELSGQQARQLLS